MLGLQTIESRQVDVTSSPSVLTVGMFNAGNRSNIIVDKAELVGTLRTFNSDMREFIMRRVNETAELIVDATSAGPLICAQPPPGDPACPRLTPPRFPPALIMKLTS